MILRADGGCQRLPIKKPPPRWKARGKKSEQPWDVQNDVWTEGEEDPWAGLSLDTAEERLLGGRAQAGGHAEGT